MERTAGILLHPTSLPSRGGIGDLGPAARAYIDWLADAGITWWQVLPLHPPGPSQSPYAATSTFAGSPWLISLEELREDGLLDDGDLDGAPEFPPERVDFGPVLEWKAAMLSRAVERFEHRAAGELRAAFDAFRAHARHWLPDYALYAAIKQAHDRRSWIEWPAELIHREPQALERWRSRLEPAVRAEELTQFLFFRQWRALHAAAAERGVRVLGDVPIFVALDSADVWAHPELFQLDRERRPTVVAGVPPDYFSVTGQLWGNPLYDWPRHAAEGYRWWIERLRHACELADAVRLDHFRGFAAYWEVPAEERVATHGRWVPGPGRALFDVVRNALGGLPLVAEDLGEITPDVIELRKALGLPGMAILQFGFSAEPRSSFIPYHHERDLVVYTGTHDNNTTVGWFREEATAAERDLLQRYSASNGDEIHWDMIRLAMASVADVAVVPHQDVAGLGSAARMNTPGRGDGNWTFRVTSAMLDERLRDRLADLVWTYGRAPAATASLSRNPTEGEG